MFVRSLLCVGGEGEWSPFAYKFTDESSTSKGIGLCKDSSSFKGGEGERERSKVGGKWGGEICTWNRRPLSV